MIAPDIDNNPPAGVNYIHLENLYTGYHKEYNKKKVEQKVSANPFSTALKQHIAAEDMCKSTCKFTDLLKFIVLLMSFLFQEYALFMIYLQKH